MAEGRRCRSGGIQALLDLIEEHPGAFAYDWRTRFHLPLSAALDGSMTWHEAWLLTRELASDPTSRVAMAINGWDTPWSRESAILADTYDLHQRMNIPKNKSSQFVPYPRPRTRQEAAELVDAERKAAIDAAFRDHLRRVGHTVQDQSGPTGDLLDHPPAEDDVDDGVVLT